MLSAGAQVHQSAPAGRSVVPWSRQPAHDRLFIKACSVRALELIGRAPGQLVDRRDGGGGRAHTQTRALRSPTLKTPDHDALAPLRRSQRSIACQPAPQHILGKARLSSSQQNEAEGIRRSR